MAYEIKKIIIYVNYMLISVNNIDKFFFFLILIYVNFMIIHVNITDRQADKHIKSIVLNLTKLKCKV